MQKRNTRLCSECGLDINGKRLDAVTCSASCRTVRYYRRKYGSQND